MSLSTASLPTYHREPNASEQRLAQHLQPGPRPVGNFVKTSRNGGIAIRLHGQDSNASMPIYGRGATVEGVVELNGKNMDTIQGVEVKMEGELQIKEVAGSGTSSSSLCLQVKTLWSRESSGACPTSLSFSFTLPSTFSDKKAEYPLPPTFEAHLSGVPGFYANISYTVSAVLKQSKVSFFGLTNPSVSMPFVYRPRNRPSIPLPASLSPKVMGTDSFYDDEDWMSSQTVAKAKSTRYESVLVKLYLPASRVFSITEPIPFNLFLSSSAFSLASFLPFAPPHSSSAGSPSVRQGTTRVQVVRQMAVDVRGISKSHPVMRGNNTDIWKTVTIGEGVFRRYDGEGGGGHDWMAWSGEVQVDKSVSVAGFKASGFSVKDYILLSMTPTDPGKAPFMDMRLTIPIKLTTDSWSVSTDERYAIGVTGYGDAEYAEQLHYQPELSYGAPPRS
ncbi:hypothetical protein SCHPADRAFT_906442 [Schizopora paradoxa]|uniref:Arrestin-like N-terminal domain-containing protein n=1 Tax=Schizopora paradoxa TaxID=27342 RepID=A0A0H2RGH4_9AGAM|nr:hypothetical protein SCHPADRAFT_906442 [Schizopora paradoxa]